VSGALLKKAASLRAWREANPVKVAAYNERRREEYRSATAADRDKTCLRCSARFTAPHANALYCPPCKKAVLNARDAAKKRRKRSRQRELLPEGATPPSKRSAALTPSARFSREKRETESTGWKMDNPSVA
jgi:hypothetical protein